MKIGYQGIPGSYSETVLADYIKRSGLSKDQVQALGYEDFSSLVGALEGGDLDLAIFPIENSTTGLITRTLDLFRSKEIYAIDEIFLEVNHTLWGLDGARVSDLREVYSHPEALGQCQSFFDRHPNIRAISYSDTAAAAKAVAQAQDPSLGALSSPRAGQIYGLRPIIETVQTERSNMTRFFIMKGIDLGGGGYGQALNRIRAQDPKRSRLMVYLQTKHQTGSLAKVLNAFEVFDCNLQGLDARPIKGSPFKYGFFIELETARLDLDFEIFWETLTYGTEYIELIGAFASCQPQA